MFKRIVLGSLVLVLAMGLVRGFVFVPSCFAQAEEEPTESITITTYYPSPYGVYNELQTNKFAVGDTDGDGQLTSADQPNRDGDIRLKPQLGDPTMWPPGEEGQFAYSADNEALYHWNSFNSQWVKQGGGEGGGGRTCYIKYNNDTDSCPTCPPGWTREDCLGVWGYCAGCAELAFAVYFPPGGDCPTAQYWTKHVGWRRCWNRYDIGQACLCCKE